MSVLQVLREIRQADRRRYGAPAEHWLVLGAGTLLLRWASRSPSPLLRLAGWAGGALLLARAASGRDGPLARLSKR